jgi:hypothetical protein
MGSYDVACFSRSSGCSASRVRWYKKGEVQGVGSRNLIPTTEEVLNCRFSVNHLKRDTEIPIFLCNYVKQGTLSLTIKAP